MYVPPDNCLCQLCQEVSVYTGMMSLLTVPGFPPADEGQTPRSELEWEWKTEDEAGGLGLQGNQNALLGAMRDAVDLGIGSIPNGLLCERSSSVPVAKI